MKLSRAISLQVTAEADTYTQSHCDVLINGHHTGISIAGKVAEAAIYLTDTRYLLFLTDDVIFEESLNVTLIDINAGILDHLTLGGPYTTGIFTLLSTEQEMIKFRFTGESLWTVTILSSPVLRRPFSDPPGVTRPFKLKKYITINASPDRC